LRCGDAGRARSPGCGGCGRRLLGVAGVAVATYGVLWGVTTWLGTFA
jgi:hypothetical protein